MSDNIKDIFFNEFELLIETYSFYASNGDIYIVKPATFREVFSPESDFIKKIKTIGAALLDNSKNQNEVFVSMLLNPNTSEYINDLISKYVYKDGKRVTLSDLTNDGLNLDDVVALITKLADVSGVNIEEVTKNGQLVTHKEKGTIAFIASLAMHTRMSVDELYTHSLPLLSALHEQIMRIKMIDAGIDPDNPYSDNEEYTSPKTAKNEVESTLPDSVFYGQLNALLK